MSRCHTQITSVYLRRHTTLRHAISPPRLILLRCSLADGFRRSLRELFFDICRHVTTLQFRCYVTIFFLIFDYHAPLPRASLFTPPFTSAPVANMRLRDAAPRRRRAALMLNNLLSSFATQTRVAIVMPALPDYAARASRVLRAVCLQALPPLRTNNVNSIEKV